MAKETIQAVRQAELNAAQIEKDAVQRKESIISDAALKAKTLTDSMTKAAKEEAAKRLSSAMKQGEKLQETAGNRAENEVMIMKQLASSKEEAAINFVLSSVING